MFQDLTVCLASPGSAAIAAECHHLPGPHPQAPLPRGSKPCPAAKTWGIIYLVVTELGQAGHPANGQYSLLSRAKAKRGSGSGGSSKQDPRSWAKTQQRSRGADSSLSEGLHQSEWHNGRPGDGDSSVCTAHCPLCSPPAEAKSPLCV